MKSSLDTLDKVRTARIQYGPCPRAIMKTPRYAEVEVTRAVKNLCDSRQIWDLFTDPLRSFTDAIPHWHRLIVVRRLGAIDVATIRSDFWSTHINGEITYKALRDHLTMDKLQDLISGRRAAGRGAASFSCFLFESLAIALLSGTAPADGDFKFGHSARMVEEESEASPRRFAYSPAEAIDTLSVTETRGHHLSRGTVPSLASATSSHLSTIATLPCEPRVIVRYQQLDDIHDITTSLCVPSWFTNPLFDAFFVEKADDKTIIWFYQITVRRERDVAGTGFGMVQEVVDKVAKARTGSPVCVKYVLIMPYETWGMRNWAVRWSLPREFSTAEGEVYVQYLQFPGDVEELVLEPEIPSHEFEV